MSISQETLRLYIENITQVIRSLEEDLEYRFSVHYNRNHDCLLTRLCDKYGSDKGGVKQTGHPYPWPPHTYTDFYSRLFDHCRLAITKVFECGLGTNNINVESSMGIAGKPGASLRAWRDYFQNAMIIGIDIDKEALFEEERIKTFCVDQTNPKEISDFWNELNLYDFDLMIDDGLHTFEAGVCLFENCASRLSNNGIYVIEDVNANSDLMKYEQYFRNKNCRVDFVTLHRPNLLLSDNNLVVIRGNGLQN